VYNVSTTTISPISTPLSASAKAAIIHDRPDPQEMGDDDRPIIEDDNYLQQDAANDIRHGNTMRIRTIHNGRNLESI